MNYIIDPEVSLRHDTFTNNYYLFCKNSGDFYAINIVGYDILYYLKLEKEIDEIAKIISEKYEMDINTCLNDANDFIKDLKDMCLIKEN
jgi:hypothetical protein